MTHQTISNQRRNSLDFALGVIDGGSDDGSDWKHERLLGEMGIANDIVILTPSNTNSQETVKC